MISYKYGFSVQKFDGKNRACGNGLYFKDLNSLWSSGINPCDYNYTLAVISNLEKILEDKEKEHEWGGGERTWFLSNKDITVATDNFGWSEDLVLPTEIVLEMMLVRKGLMEKWSREDILKLIGQSFNKVKNERYIFMEDEESCRYKIKGCKNNVVIILILQEDDFGLNKVEYLSQIKFNDKFLAPI